MTADNWIKIISLIEDLLKTIIPSGTIFLILWSFKEEIKILIKNGGFKISAPGISVETFQQQQEKVGKKEKQEIEALNKEVENVKVAQQKLTELQTYTSREKDTYFLGYHFEKTYRLIFPSQMVILTAMENHNGELADVIAKAIFRRTIWNQQLHISYESFIGFLIQSGLMTHHQESGKDLITPLGRLFLQYLKGSNIPLKLPPNDTVTNSL